MSQVESSPAALSLRYVRRLGPTKGEMVVRQRLLRSRGHRCRYQYPAQAPIRFPLDLWFPTSANNHSTCACTRTLDWTLGTLLARKIAVLSARLNLVWSKSIPTRNDDDMRLTDDQGRQPKSDAETNPPRDKPSTLMQRILLFFSFRPKRHWPLSTAKLLRREIFFFAPALYAILVALQPRPTLANRLLAPIPAVVLVTFIHALINIGAARASTKRDNSRVSSPATGSGSE